MFNLPNLITLGNLVAGSLGIIYVSDGGPELAFWFVAVAVFLDFFDGMAARKLGIGGDMGKELDSLADMVSFGVLPGLTMYFHIQSVSGDTRLAYVGLLIIAFSALRLAKFNTDLRQTDAFYGLPTPSNAFFMVSLPHIDLPWLQQPWVLVSLVVLFSYFLIAEIRMFALKFKTARFADNKWKYLAMVVGIVLIILLGIPAIPILVGAYILFSIALKYVVQDTKK